MSLIFNKELIATNRNLAKQKTHLDEKWRAFEARERNFGREFGMQYNAAARIPTDAYREVMEGTKSVMVGDEGGVLFNDLMGLSRNVDIGKIVVEYRRGSDSGKAKASISGQKAWEIDKPVYDFDGALVLVHDDAFGFEWREYAAMQSEGFDAVVDASANSIRAVRRSMVGHLVNGVTGVKYKTSEAKGIKTNTSVLALDLDASGLNVDLTSASLTYADAEKVFIAALKKVQGDNFVTMPLTFYVSSSIWFNLLSTKTNSSEYTTLVDALRKIPGVADIKFTTDTTVLSGNEFFAIAMSQEYIMPVVGQAVGVNPLVRQNYADDFQWVAFGAVGLLIKSDYAGKSGVLWEHAIP